MRIYVQCVQCYYEIPANDTGQLSITVTCPYCRVTLQCNLSNGPYYLVLSDGRKVVPEMGKSYRPDVEA